MRKFVAPATCICFWVAGGNFIAKSFCMPNSFSAEMSFSLGFVSMVAGFIFGFKGWRG